MAEYVLSEDDDKEEIARLLLEHAGDERAREIEWRPRPDRPQGGVFYVPDDLSDGLTSDRLSRVDSTPDNDPAKAGNTEEGDGTTRASRAQARRAARAAEASKE